MILRIGSRKSPLARLQAYKVGDALLAYYPELKIEYFFKESLGDKNLTDPLWKMPERGVFTEDFVEDLLNEKVDLVIHSWKDLPVEDRPGLKIYGCPKRADQRDLFLFRKESIGKQHLQILTSSPRREFSAKSFLKKFLPFTVKDLEFAPVRGNVNTRMRKLCEGQGDGLFLAKAALDRLLTDEREEFLDTKKEIRNFLKELNWMVLPLSYFPTAPAQAALAIEGRTNRTELEKILAPILCKKSEDAVKRERTLFRTYGGGCHQKIGISCKEHPRLGILQYFYGTSESAGIEHWIKTDNVMKPPKHRWPEESSPQFFNREAIYTEHPRTDLFIARSEALPDWKMKDEILWGAGTETWMRLAKRGFWVHGCQEGLGEEQPPIDALLGRKAQFTKLSHDSSCNNAVFPVLPTYKLTPKEIHLPKVDAYFWMSETSFLRALEIYPNIRDAEHACGPGHTAAALEKVLGKPVSVYINYRHWKEGNPLRME
ncbi:MAG: hydroxymethylbilane synthase [Oligoflexia bacterium]|nr:hydroxymethylbilane synthase [Oligoflexia bacterium]